jgi:hypothetical protein
VPASGSNLERAFGAGLAFHVAHVGACCARRHGGGLQAGPAVVGHVGIARSHAARRQEGAHHIQKMPCAHHLRGGHQGGLFSAAGGQHQLRGDLLGLQRQTGGQRAAHGAQFARQRQLARKLIARQTACVHLPAGGEDAQCNRQIEAP